MCHSLFSRVLWRLVSALNRVFPCFLGNDRHDNGFLSSDLRPETNHVSWFDGFQQLMKL